MLQTQREDKEVPLLYVNLDLEPELRWKNVTKYYKDIGAFPAALILPSPVSEAVQALLKAVKIDEEYMREMRAIVADIDDPSVTVESVLFANLRYELSGFSESPAGLASTFAQMDLADFFQPPSKGCSGLLAAMPNGTVVHGRNMDYAGFEVVTPDGRVYHWPQVTTEVIFLRHGRPLFVSTHWPGLVGVHTAMRFDGWSFEQNTRLHSKDADVLYGLLQGSEAFVFRGRKIMETVPDFETAVQELYKANYMAPQYFIVAGTKPYEGAVITVDRGGVHKASSPKITRLSSELTAIKDGESYKGWHIIQTNDDLDHLPLDYRRPVQEIKLITSQQETVSVPWVLNQMLSPPLYNPYTVFTTVFVPQSGYHRTIAHMSNER